MKVKSGPFYLSREREREREREIGGGGRETDRERKRENFKEYFFEQILK